LKLSYSPPYFLPPIGLNNIEAGYFEVSTPLSPQVERATNGVYFSFTVPIFTKNSSPAGSLLKPYFLRIVLNASGVFF
jgi:hypothetical protein